MFFPLDDKMLCVCVCVCQIRASGSDQGFGFRSEVPGTS